MPAELAVPTEELANVDPPTKPSGKKEQQKEVTSAPVTIAIAAGEQVELVVTIQSARDLIAADKTGKSDPYVKVLLGSKELHKTKHILKTLNPIYDEDSKASFVLRCDAQALVGAGGLTLELKDWDRGFGGNDPLGHANVPAVDLYGVMKTEQPLSKEYSIIPPPGHEGKPAGFVTLGAKLVTSDNVPAKSSGGLLGRVAAKVAPKPAATATARAMPAMEIPNEDKEIFIEIVRARELLAADKTGLSE